MNLTDIHTALTGLGMHPSKALGQNFMVDGNITRIILEAADLSPSDTVLEIGPGLGALTRPLIERVDRLVAIERDHRLARFLQGEFKDVSTLNLIEADALKVDFHGLGLPNLGFKLIANLPYSVGTLLLLRLIESEPSPKKIVVTVQREVAERLIASPHTSEYGAASVLAQLLYSVKITHRVSRTCFWPVPKVESAVITMDWFPHPHLQISHTGKVMQLVHAGFGQRRKMLRGRVVSEKMLLAVGALPTARAEELSVAQWIALESGVSTPC